MNEILKESVKERVDLFENAFTDFEVVKPFISLEKVNVEDIIVPPNRARKQGLKGLKASVAQLGVLVPPSLMRTENKKKYILINGIRRVHAALKNGFTELQSLVYNFDDSAKAKKAIPYLELILNQYEPYTIGEVWDTSQFLESKMVNFSPELIEYLLNLRPGEYTKLVEVMRASESDMIDIRDQLLEGTITINQAYKKLDMIRKKVTRQELLDQKEELMFSVGETGGFDEAVKVVENSTEPMKREGLEDDEIAALLNLANCNMETLDLSEIEEIDRTSEIRQNKKQVSRDKKPVDPALRKARMIKDGYSCQCCTDIDGEEHMYILDFHHVVPVSLGGVDSMENGITLCLNCHQLVHLYASGDLFLGKLEDKKEIMKFKKVLTLGNTIIDAMKKLHMPKEEFKKLENPHFVARKFPGYIKQQLEKA